MGHAKLGGVEMKNLSTATPCTKHSIRKGEKLARHHRTNKQTQRLTVNV